MPSAIEPRLDLPDLSAYTGVLPAAIAAGTAAVATDAEVPAKGDGEAAQVVPEYYESFVKQADQVRARLLSVGEPEIRSVKAPPSPQRAAQISDAFTRAAHRHRHPTEPAAAPAPAHR
jgi:hypothetical protein